MEPSAAQVPLEPAVDLDRAKAPGEIEKTSCLEPWVAAWRAPGAKLNVRNGVCNLPTSAS